jgi:metal-responsive CopG/Arc/MetJ family transcriptional regulator
MSAQRIAISLPEELVTEVAAAAEAQAGGNVSAWMARAALHELEHEREQQRLKAGWAEFFEEYQAEHGRFTAEELEAAGIKLWGE